MKIKRLYQTLRLWTIRGDSARAKWAGEHKVYGAMGENVAIMDRKVPLYAKMIRFHNNIQVASNVSFITHDVLHVIINRRKNARGEKSEFLQEYLGCIEVMDNVFIGSRTVILGNVRIGPDAVIAAGSVVTCDVPPNSIVGGVPAKVIGEFDALVEKRKQHVYPVELRPRNQEVNDELVEYMWNRFIKDRTENVQGANDENNSETILR